MKKNGRTIKKDISIIYRGIKEFEKILPKQMKHVFIRCFLAAVIPFITTAVSASIIDALIAGQKRSNLIIICFVGVGIVFFLSLWKNYEDCKIGVGYSRLFSSHEISLTNKSYSMPYEILEMSKTRKLRDEVSGSIQLSGAGMASLYWDMDVFWTNAIAAVIAIVILLKYMYEMFSGDISVNLGYGNSVGAISFMAVLVVFCSYVSCKMTGKRFDVDFEVFQNGSKYSRYGDFYNMNYLPNEHAAMDARIYRQEETIISECQSKCYKHFAEGKRKELNAVSRYDGVKLACSCICGCLVYIIIGQKALQGIIGYGSIILLYSAVTMFIEAMSRMAEIITDLRNNNEHLLRYFQYMDLPEEAVDVVTLKKTVFEGEHAAQEKKEMMTGLCFQNVSFKYPESEQFVLKDINLEIRAGEKLAIVGENGSGKTTLIKLICRLYKPTMGKILLNGKDIWQYSYEDYIAMIATVFQDFSLFAFSLAENIAASQEYDRERILLALKKAGITAKVDCFEKGMEQPLFHDFDENGVDLSGGEAQKVAIARAVYKDADIMILDEPTAALDPYAEYEIYKNFGAIATGKTVLSISHRLSSCRMCDYIVVIHQGKIVQCGTHDDLVQDKNGKYYKLWNAQAQYYC